MTYELLHPETVNWAKFDNSQVSVPLYFHEPCNRTIVHIVLIWEMRIMRESRYNQKKRTHHALFTDIYTMSYSLSRNYLLWIIHLSSFVWKRASSPYKRRNQYLEPILPTWINFYPSMDK